MQSLDLDAAECDVSEWGSEYLGVFNLIDLWHQLLRAPSLLWTNRSHCPKGFVSVCEKKPRVEGVPKLVSARAYLWVQRLRLTSCTGVRESAVCDVLEAAGNKGRIFASRRQNASAYLLTSTLWTLAVVDQTDQTGYQFPLRTIEEVT
jgi:hypothetical protein